MAKEVTIDQERLAAKIEALAQKIFPEALAGDVLRKGLSRGGAGYCTEPADKIGLVIPLVKLSKKKRTPKKAKHHLEFIIGDNETEASLTEEHPSSWSGGKSTAHPVITERLQNKQASDFQGWLFKARSRWLVETGQAVPKPKPSDNELTTLLTDLQQELAHE